MSIASRLNKLEAILAPSAPRRVVIWCGVHYAENWTEREQGVVSLFVKIPNREADPLDHLTDAQRVEIRPDDELTIIEAVNNGRDDHLQTDRPPSKRRPWRMVEGGQAFELQDLAGAWHRHEFGELAHA
jgi:hypothetical protein